VFALCASLATTAPKCNPSRYITVDTSNRPITGHIADNSPCIIEYLGIPYAKPPVNELRFAPPQRIASFSKIPFQATKFGYDCPLSPSKKVDYPDMTPQAQQIISYFASAAETPQSEDCLTLNIWSKATSNSVKANKPVLVFFYGGRKLLIYLLFTVRLTQLCRVCY
jgi:carboxylesterase type B